MSDTDSKRVVKRWIYDQRLLKAEGVTSVHLSRALARLCGSTIQFPPDRETDLLADLIGEHQHILFFLVDGLGMNQRRFFPSGGFLDRTFTREIRSVIPSTTSAALTSLASGHWPAAHGIIGWFTHLPNFGETIIPLKASERFSYRSIEKLGFTLDDVMVVDSMLPTLERTTRSYTLRKLRKGAFAQWSTGDTDIEGYRSIENALKRVRRWYKIDSGSSYAYLYYPEVDRLAHEHGWDGIEVIREISRIDSILSRMRSMLPKTVRMIVTADHGHINVPDDRHCILRHNDPVNELLQCPPSAESRMPVFHVKPGSEERFSEIFKNPRFPDFRLITPEQAETLEIFGPDSLAPETRERLGTFIGFSPNADAIEYVPEGREPVGHRGMHGGMSEDEVKIPLFLA